MDEPADEVAAFGESADRVVSGTLSQAVDSLRGDGSAAPEPGPRLVAQSNGARHPPSMSNATQDGNAPIPQRQQLGKRKRRAWKVNTWLSDLAKTWDDSTLNNPDVAAMRLLIDQAAKDLPDTRLAKTAKTVLLDKHIVSVTNSVKFEKNRNREVSIPGSSNQAQ